MPKPPRIAVPPAVEDPPPDHDELTDEELAQEKLGDIALLSGPEFQDWEWHIHRIRTREEIASDPARGMRELMDKKIGPIDVFELKEQLGGGTFELWGFWNNGDGQGKRLRKKPVISFAGPRKRFDAPVTAPAAVHSSGTDPALLQLLSQINQRLDRLDKPAAVSSGSPSLKDLADTLITLDTLRGRTQSAPADPNKEIVSTMLGLVEKGIEIGQTREVAPGEPGTDWTKIFETVVPIFDKFLSRIPPRRPPPPIRPPGTPVEPAAPPVVTTETREPETPPNYRWVVAVESLAKAIARADDPLEFTVTLDHILNEQEIAMLRASTLEQVMGELEGAKAIHPILGTDGARSFIEAMLAELKNPSPES